MSKINLEEYMQAEIERDGTFRGWPLEWTVEEAGSGATCIAIKYGIVMQWGGESGWGEKWAPGYFATQRAWVIKKDGTLNKSAVDMLAKAGLWDGDWDKLSGPVPKVIALIDIKAEHSEQYGDQYRVDWVNANADEPAARGGFKPADAGLLAKLSARFQGQTRALAGGTAAPQAAPAAAAASPEPIVPEGTWDPKETAPSAAPAAPAPPSSPGSWGGDDDELMPPF